jgi:DNA-binding CsgD family transcriptional regulator
VWIRSPEVIGRSRELHQLKQALCNARDRRGGAIFLVGQGGIGKSRLASEAAGIAADHGMEVWRGRGSTIGPMVPFRPLAEALLSRFRDSPAPDEPGLGPYLVMLRHFVPDWNNGDSAPGNVSLLMIAEAVLRLIAATSREHGCLITLDDLQDADAETLFVVEYLVDNLGSSHTMLIGVVRDEPCAALDLVRAAAQRRSCQVLDLGVLSRTDVRRLTAACLEAPPDQVPASAADLLWHNSGGNPLVIEELLHEMVNDGLVVKGPTGWQVVSDLTAKVPTALVNSVALRTDRLGSQGRTLLSTAAVLGRKFPLSVVQSVTGMDDHTLLSYLQAAMSAQLITADESAPDWYSFRHPLIAEALLRNLTPTASADLAERAANAVEALHPGLPGEWCPLAGTLRLTANDPGRAGTLFAESGTRALAGGAADSAVAMLTRADELLADHADAGTRANVLETLLQALGETGQFDRAFQLSASFAELGTSARAAALHTKLAWAAYLAGRQQDGMNQVAAARALLGPDAAEEQLAAIDAVEANLLLEAPGADCVHDAEQLAAHALRVAERTSAPDVACQALQVLGMAADDRDPDEAQEHFERARRIAEEHGLPIWRTHVLMRLGRHRLLANGDTHDLELARLESLRTGTITVTCAIDSITTLHGVLCGDFDAAAESLDRNSAVVRRLQLTDLVRYTEMTRAVLAAHQGDRRRMEEALAAFHLMGGEQSPEVPYCFGLAMAFCALLEENVDQARRELAKVTEWDERNQGRLHLSGRHGLRLLLDVLAGDLAPADYPAAAAVPTARMRWNRQFVLLGEAVLLGRDGKRGQAEEVVRSALRAAAPYPVALHLGLRLVAETAAEDGWGDPVEWLRRAEDFFHQASVTAVASACRALLRQIGAFVPQHRVGLDRLPDELRTLRVTVREYDVFLLLGERLSNKDIGHRLHISPRTVEKHVSQLMAKTNSPDRASLFEYAAALRIQQP